MISLHVPFGFFPDPVGGTEVYVAELATALAQTGHPAIIAAPGPTDSTYVHDGLTVHRFAASTRIDDVSQLYGGTDDEAARCFARILDRERPDVFHMHAFTHACSIGLVREAKARHIPVVFTYHTPTVSCQRGTLLEFGDRLCDGHVDAARCAACTLHGLGVNGAASRLLGRMPIAVGQMVEAAGLRGGSWTALRMSSLIERRHQAMDELFSLADRLVVLTPWVRDVLRRNHVPESKMVESRHGIQLSPMRRARPTRTSNRIRVAHLGRLDPVKGTGVLIRALTTIPDAPVDLDIFGIVEGQRNADLRNDLHRLAEGDPRITFREAFKHQSVVERLADYDLVAVPSQWLETGPLVVLEAFAAGVPVFGSALGGLLDKVTDNVDGLLIRPHDSVEAWAATLRRTASERDLLPRLASGVRPPRSMGDVAGEMLAIYQALGPEASRGLAPVAAFTSTAIH
jgi:glycosyltransferase involved in cell wall biosynthesis